MKLIVLLQFPMIVTKCDSYKTNLEPRPRRERRRRARLASVLILRTLRRAIITFLKRRKLHHELWEERRHWIMVFGGYADDLRTRPSAITSLSKMPRIRVLVTGHGLCPAGASQIAECKRVSRYLSGGTSYKPTSGQAWLFLIQLPVCP